MVYAGCDIGASVVKAVIIKDRKITGTAKRKIDDGLEKVTKGVLKEALQAGGLSLRRASVLGITGREARSVKFFRPFMPKLSFRPEELCIAKATHKMNLNIRTVIDIGALGFKIISIDERGMPIDIITNEKCASGGGRFLENISKALEVDLDKMGEIALISKEPCTITNQCVVFAETEVISLVNKGVDKKHILGGIVSSLASQVASAAKRGGLKKDVAFIGGTSKNQGIYYYLEKNLDVKLKKIPLDPQFISAYGAAILAGNSG
ncbi:MAG: acyl-CoA dehydratase activase [Thermodesulfobacteriota bacterium]|nr:acyl-CoA dehydratase activase [Thermodesulfobacteriota bacterium]